MEITVMKYIILVFDSVKITCSILARQVLDVIHVRPFSVATACRPGKNHGKMNMTSISENTLYSFTYMQENLLI